MARGSGGRLGVLVGIALSSSLRLAASRDAVGPMVVADESAYLAMARFMAGRGEIWDLGLASPYGFGYSVLLAPLYRLFQHPETVYRAAVLLNIAAAALLVPLLDAVLRRITTLGRPASVVAATIGACLPSFVVTANRAWSDAVAPLFFVLVLLCGLGLLRTSNARWLGGLAVAQVGAIAIHNRFLILWVPVVLLLVALVRARRLEFRPAVLAVGAMALGTIAVRAINAAIHRRLYEPGGTVDPIRDTLDRLDPAAIGISAAGQAWYLLVSTIGLGGLGFIALLRGLRRSPGPAAGGPSTPRPVVPDREAAIWLLIAMVVPFLVSMVYISGQPMPNHLVYGRYNEPLAIVLVAVGAAAVLAPSRIANRLVTFGSVAAGIVLTTAIVWLPRHDRLRGPFNRSGILGLSALDAASTQRLRYVAFLAAVLMIPVLVIALLPRRRVIGLAALGLVLLPLGTARILSASSFERSGTPASIRTAPLDPGETVHVADLDRLTGFFYRYPFFRDDLSFHRARTHEWDGSRELVLASARNEEAPEAGYRIAWVDPSAAVALWVAPGARQDAAARSNELLIPTITARQPGDDDASLTIEGGIEGARLVGTVHVDRPGTGPWAGVDRGGFGLDGRIRIAVTILSDCTCRLGRSRIDLGRFVPASDTTLSIPFDIELSEPPGDDIEIEFRLVREGIGPFGTPARIGLA